MSYLDIKITVLERYYTNNIKYCTLGEWLNYIRQPHDIVTQIRNLAPDLETKQKNKDQIGELKKNHLPMVIVSSLLYGGKTEKDIIQSLPLLSIEVDAQENTWITDWEQFKHDFVASLNNGKNLVYCGLSVSGLGIWAVVALAYPERINEQITAIKRDFERHHINGHTINLDTSNLGVTARRFLSYDPEPFINEDAEPYKGIVQEKPKREYQGKIDKDFNLEEWLQRNGISYRDRSNDQRYKFEVECPWSHLHSSRSKSETMVFQDYDTKMLGFKCMHDHCADKHWSDYRRYIEKGIL